MGQIMLGSKVRDKITNFAGTVVKRLEHLGGQVELGVQSDLLEGGKPIDQQWFFEDRLELLSTEISEVGFHQNGLLVR